MYGQQMYMNERNQFGMGIHCIPLAGVVCRLVLEGFRETVVDVYIMMPVQSVQVVV